MVLNLWAQAYYESPNYSRQKVKSVVINNMAENHEKI